MTDVLVASGLRKRFGEVQALADVSFSVRRGEFFGFLGPNGAGKTTTINLLTGLARPDTGTIRVGGLDCTRNPKAAQHLLGVVSDESNLYPELSGFDNLTFCGALYGMGKTERRHRAGELLEIFGLAEAGHRLFGGYSKGMKRKLTIAAGLLHKPEILFLDEPTTGIDVASARQIRRILADLHRDGTTLFLTTHYIEEAERLCDRIAFLVKGRIIRIDSVEHLLTPLQKRHRLRVCCGGLSGKIVDILPPAFPDLTFSCPTEDMLLVEADQPVAIGPLVRLLEEHGAQVLEAIRLRPSLEDVFVEITGIEADALHREKEKSGAKGGAS